VIVLGALDRLFFVAGSSWSAAVQVVSILLALPVLVVVGAVGVNLLPGRLIEQSQGAVDNGAACAIVLALAARLSQAQLSQTRVTLAFFGGEEVSMQGSLAYVRGRAWPLPTAAINLELMGQRGPFVIWQREGNVLTSVPTDPALNQQVAAVVAEVTGGAPALVGGINSDGYSFIRNGIPACVLGSYDPQQGGGGLHRPTDSLERVALERLPVAVAILERLAGQYERRCEISSTVH
jgi:Zn-dependent M28 family amino/carboxypeptidase